MTQADAQAQILRGAAEVIGCAAKAMRWMGTAARALNYATRYLPFMIQRDCSPSSQSSHASNTAPCGRGLSTLLFQSSNHQRAGKGRPAEAAGLEQKYSVCNAKGSARQPFPPQEKATETISGT